MFSVLLCFPSTVDQVYLVAVKVGFFALHEIAVLPIAEILSPRMFDAFGVSRSTYIEESRGRIT